MSNQASPVAFNMPMNMSFKCPQMTSTDVTQKFLLEQSLLRLYNYPWAKIQLMAMTLTNQFLPLVLQRVLTGFKRRRILEVNCGYGFYTQLMSILYTQASLFGIDSSYHNVAVATQSSGTQPNVRFCHSSTRYLNDMAERPVDLILFHVSPVLLAADSQANALTSLKKDLKKIQPWLAPGGDLIFKLDTPWMFRAKQIVNFLKPRSLNELLNGNRTIASFFAAPAVAAETLTHLTNLLGFRALPTFNLNQQIGYQFLHMENPLNAEAVEKLFAETVQVPESPKTIVRKNTVTDAIAMTGQIQPKAKAMSEKSIEVTDQVAQQLAAKLDEAFHQADGLSGPKERQRLQKQAQDVRQQIGRQLQQSREVTAQTTQQNAAVKQNLLKHLPQIPEHDDTLSFIFSRKWGNFAQELGQ